MRCPFLTVVVIAASVVAVIVIAAAIAVSTIDIDALDGPIADRIKAATGRDLQIGGGIALKFSLKPRIELREVTLSNAPWASEPSLVTAKRLEAQIALLPLLRRRFEIQRITVSEPVIVLETDRNGRGNWEFAPPPVASVAPGTNESPKTGGLALGVGDLAIDHGVLSFRNGRTGTMTRIVIERLALQARDDQAPVNATFRGAVDGIAVSFTGNAGPLATLLAGAAPYPVTLDGAIAGRKTAVSAKVSRKEQETLLDDLNVGLGESRIAGSVNVMTIGGRRQVKLVLAPGRHAERVHLSFSLQAGKLNVPAMESALFGGSVAASIVVETVALPPRITMRLTGRDLDLGTLLSWSGIPREVRGGKTAARFDLSARGDSPHEWGSSATGDATITVGAATLVNAKGDTRAPLSQLASAINPFQGAERATELKCVVIRLPLAHGVARVDRSVAIETDKLGVAMTGTIDFRDETLDVALHPSVRQGIPIDIAQVAELVRVRGPWRDPHISVDAVTSAATVARLGAVVASGGLSALGVLAGARLGDSGWSLRRCHGRRWRAPQRARWQGATGERAGGLAEGARPPAAALKGPDRWTAPARGDSRRFAARYNHLLLASPFSHCLSP